MVNCHPETKGEKRHQYKVKARFLLTEIHETGLQKDNKVTVNNLQDSLSEIISENLDVVLKQKSDCLIVHAGTNDLTKLKIK